MDAVKFVKEVRRMRSTDRNYKIFNYNDRPEDVVKEVEEWSAAHPRKTRQSEFLKQWPNVPMKDMVVDICPCCLDEEYPCRQSRNCVSDTCCADCRREFWGQEVS